MPSNYAHHRFGQDALKLLPLRQQRAIGRMQRLYDAGTHGADIFFYSNPFVRTIFLPSGKPATASTAGR